MSIARQQAEYDDQQHPHCWGADETTPAEALRGRLLRAALAAQKHVDSVEVEVTEFDGDCVVRLDFWACTWDDRAKLADALVALADEVRPFAGK